VNGTFGFVKELGNPDASTEICSIKKIYQFQKFADRRQRYLDHLMKRIFFLFLTSLAISFCGKTPPPDRNVTCYVRFDEAQGLAKAEFSMQAGATGGTSIDIPGGVRYQGVDMTPMPVQGLQYRKEFKATFKEDHVFSWEEKNLGPQTLKLQMSPFFNFHFDSDTLDRKQATQLHWEGVPFEKGEALVLIWENEKSGATKSMELYTTKQGNSLDFAAAKLSELEPGDWKLYLVRKKLVKSAANGLFATAILEHYTKVRRIKLL
jgi:hypothetical protein